MTGPMSTAAAVEYFTQFASAGDGESMLVVAVFTAPAGFRWCAQPHEQLSPELVGELAAAGVCVIQVSAYGRHAEFDIVPAGPISPAYLTGPTVALTVAEVRCDIAVMRTKEVLDATGSLVGAVAPVAVPGVPPVGVLVPAMTWVGWVHDWDANNPTSEYLPVCLGVNDDPDALVAEIKRRATGDHGTG